MSDLEFYEVVEILTTARAAALGLGRGRGIVVGISDDDDQIMYAVLVGDRTFMLGVSDLARTGERVDREEIYGDSTIRVSPERYKSE